jgi:hypothetical protein
MNEMWSKDASSIIMDKGTTCPLDGRRTRRPLSTLMDEASLLHGEALP